MFAALVPPETVAADLGRFLEPRRDVPGPRWTLPDQWHVTLAFAGAVPGRALDDLLERVGEAASRHPVGPVRVAGGGCFPDVTRARVLWAGVAHDGRLPALAAAVRSAFAGAGAAPEGGRFVPHVTLARFGRPVEATRWFRLLETYEGPVWTPGEVVLVESHLPRERGHRPRHEVVDRLPLG